jgi:hypothetical protein
VTIIRSTVPMKYPRWRRAPWQSERNVRVADHSPQLCAWIRTFKSRNGPKCNKAGAGKVYISPEMYLECVYLRASEVLMSATTKLTLAGLIGLSLTVFPASASVITFTGADLGVQPGSPSGPNSTLAAANFDAAAALLGNESLITFESAPVGSFTSITVAPGVTISGSDVNANHQAINNTFDASFPSLDGYNTTPGGSHFAEMMGGSLVFTFATPVQFFGAYLSGVQNFLQDTYTFSDGTSQTINVPEAGTSNSVGELVFVGFTDAGKSITSVTVNAGTSGFDAIGVDDVRFQSAVVGTPEPNSAVSLLTGCFFALTLWFRRRRAVRARAF